MANSHYAGTWHYMRIFKNASNYLKFKLYYCVVFSSYVEMYMSVCLCSVVCLHFDDYIYIIGWRMADWFGYCSWHLYVGHMVSMMQCCMCTIVACLTTLHHSCSCWQFSSRQLSREFSWPLSRYHTWPD